MERGAGMSQGLHPEQSSVAGGQDLTPLRERPLARMSGSLGVSNLLGGLGPLNTRF